MGNLTGGHVDLDAIRVVDRPQRSRFEAVRAGDVLGYIDYTQSGNTRVMTHTEVLPDLRGKGIGHRLAAGALASTAASRLKVVPRCGFVADYIRNHPEYHALL